MLGNIVGWVVLGTLAAQQGAQVPPPAGWRARYDTPTAAAAAGAWNAMEPGFHLVTKVAGIFYQPTLVANGRFRAEALIHLFGAGGEKGGDANHVEGFGLIVGGRDLEGPAEQYLYFLVRDDGKFLIKRRKGTATSEVMPWTASSAIHAKPADKPNSSNLLAVETTGAGIDFYINGTKVASRPASEGPVDGIVGVRVNHGLNVHVERVTVTPLKG